MNKGPIFLAGFITGVAATFFGLLIIISIFGHSSKPNEIDVEEEVEDVILSPITKQPDDIQYFEVKGRKGDVSLFTDMPKDSARVLMGKPTSVSMHNYGGTVREEWKYEFSGQGTYGTTRFMTLEFRDGKLSGIRDY